MLTFIDCKIMARNFVANTAGYCSRHGKAARIVTYHSISDKKNKCISVPPDLFESHLVYLTERGYRSYALRDVVNNRREVMQNAPSVVITFDDGLFDNWTNAVPLLRKYKMTATFFVPTAFIEDTNSIIAHPNLAEYAGSKMLSWNNLGEMVELGFEIGGHSHAHVKMSELSESEAQREIVLPKELIEKRIGYHIYSFAYPKGHSDSFGGSTMEIVKRMGYTAACTMISGTISENSDMFRLPRIGITGYDTVFVFGRKLSGFYDCLDWLESVP